MSDYRTEVARAVHYTLCPAIPDAPCDVDWRAADAVLGVRDSEMARLNGKLGAALGERFEALEELRENTGVLRLLRRQRDEAEQALYSLWPGWSAGVAEARLERPWRDRCGEPGRFPVRCRRDLSHPSPHIGIGDGPVPWDGLGNATSAQVTDHKCFDSSASDSVRTPAPKDSQTNAEEQSDV